MFKRELSVKQKSFFLIFSVLIGVIVLALGIICYSRFFNNEEKVSSLTDKESVQKIKSIEGGVKSIEGSAVKTTKGSIKAVESENKKNARVDSVERVVQ